MSAARVRVAPAAPDRGDALAPVFGRAFASEPMMLWPMGLRGDVVDPLTRCFGCFLEPALPLGLIWEAGTAGGAAAWFPPDTAIAPEDHPWNQAAIHALTDDGGRRYDDFWEWIDSRAPDEPHWLLDSIAVDPALQGRGVGRALIEGGLARAREDGVGAFLSTGTPRNVDIYARCGFRVVEHRDAPGGGPHIWFLRWDP